MLRKWSLLIGGAVLTFAMLCLFFVKRASEDTVLAKNEYQRILHNRL